MKGFLRILMYLQLVGVAGIFVAAIWAFVLDQIDGYRWRKARSRG